MLGDSSERMCRMESSPSRQSRQHRKDSAESSVFDSVLGVGAAINLQALECYASPKRSTNILPATYFSSRSLTQVAVNNDMGQAAEVGVHGQRLPDYHYPGRGIQNSCFVLPGRQIEGVPDYQQRRLALQPLDGKDIYHGLERKFLEWG
uniref:AlNc14C811G12536 protein n=1 Tax=Albugo laibachii Nc14 TaxID=890382 RepID=F0X236_9STRA|nr:AlNc14C811G12536 [Albugo laibachii Nc14]|eukprot:CCA27904.1 AlNc14C811G12536 [Albugo laibachii Nc14]